MSDKLNPLTVSHNETIYFGLMLQDHFVQLLIEMYDIMIVFPDHNVILAQTNTLLLVLTTNTATDVQQEEENLPCCNSFHLLNLRKLNIF